MKVKLGLLNPNPFKKNINEGSLNESQIERLKSNIEELGLMGSIPVIKKNDKYYLVSHHHRVKALKDIYSDDYEVEVIVHDYNDNQLFKGMVIENLTQRKDELLEVAENLNAIRNYLRNINRPDAGQMISKRNDGRGGRIDESGSAQHIADWLNNNGEVISKSKICEYLKVFDNLDRELLAKSSKVFGGEKKEGEIGIEDAKNLSRIKKEDQVLMCEILDDTGLDYKEKSKLITAFNKAPEEIQEAVKIGDIDIKDVKHKSLKHNLVNETNPQILMPTIDEVTMELNNEWIKLSDRIIKAKKIITSFDDNDLYQAFNSPRRKKLVYFVDDVKNEVQEFLVLVKDFSDKLSNVVISNE